MRISERFLGMTTLFPQYVSVVFLGKSSGPR
jgi:hypothetical protein